jgi:succinyl-diaminopimelate desuccinylase
VVPDECVVTVNFRFAPDRDAAAAERHVREVFDGFELVITDLAPGALPGLAAPAAQEFLSATGVAPAAKYGWTDVARFAALGIPALNYGPGDPNLAHTREEHVYPTKITDAVDVLRRFLG